LEGQNILMFNTGKNSVWSVTSSGKEYIWSVEPSPGFGGYAVALIPTGIDFSFNGQKFLTDKTKVRIITVPDLNVYYIDENASLTLYYREQKNKAVSAQETASGKNVISLNDNSFPSIQIKHATNDILDGFNTYYEFNDTNRQGSKIVIWANFTLRDFNFLSINFDYEQSNFVVEQVLTSINELTTERALLINNANISYENPIRGISYSDEGIKKYFYINESENYKSLSLHEFNPRAVIIENAFNNNTSLFAYVISNEHIYAQQFENDEPFLNNRTILEYTETNLLVSSNNVNIIVHIWGGIYQIYKIIINPNSEYLSKFPYRHMNDYLSDRNFGEIGEYSANHIRYSLKVFDTDAFSWDFSLTIYFNADGTLLNAEFGFPMG